MKTAFILFVIFGVAFVNAGPLNGKFKFNSFY